eukprot:scaffold21.g2131.t1
MFASLRARLFAGASAAAAAGACALLLTGKAEAAARPSALDPNEWRSLKLVHKEVLTPRSSNPTVLFRFEFPDAKQPAGLPVASCLLTRAPIGSIKDDGTQTMVIRPYTPISRPYELGHLDLAIKVYPAGVGVGGEKSVCVEWWVGGQVAEEVIRQGLPLRMSLIFANVSEKDIIAKQRLDGLAHAFPDQFSIFYVVDKVGSKDWAGGVGYLTPDLLRAHIPPPGPDTLVLFVSGDKAPDKSQGELSGLLKQLGYSPDQDARCRAQLQPRAPLLRTLSHSSSSSNVDSRWHRLYLLIDSTLARHVGYKLWGGPSGFLVAFNVAEPDSGHAATALAVARQLLQDTEHVLVPGRAPLDLALAVSSGAANSGLLGTASLTYQVVGQVAAVVQELQEMLRVPGQPPLVVAGATVALLDGEAQAFLARLGTVQLQSVGGAPVELFTLPQFAGATWPVRAQPALPAAAPVPEPHEGVDEAAAEVAAEAAAEAVPASGDAYLTIFCSVLYACVLPLGLGRPWLPSGLQLHVAPLAALWLAAYSAPLYLGCHEWLWVLHRLCLVASASLPGSPALAAPGHFAFGFVAVLADTLVRRVRPHVQLASSFATYLLALLLMGLHAPGTPGAELVTEDFLSLWALGSVAIPLALSLLADQRSRQRFEEAQARARGPAAAATPAGSPHTPLAGLSNCWVGT